MTTEKVEVLMHYLTLESQLTAVQQLMSQDISYSYLLMPYYKRLLLIASRDGIEPHLRPMVESLD